MTPVNFNQLYYFYMVAEHGSIARVSELLHITPQTISGQISALEDSIGARLFTRQSRRLTPTELGNLVHGYAADIFQLGDELKAVLTQQHSQWQSFTVGITDVLPKTLVYEMLKPVLTLPVKLVCREGELTSLLAELAVNKLDMVLADQPIQTGSHVKAYSHLVAESSMAVYATQELATSLSNGFPESLNNQRFLLQGKKSLIRQKLLGWFSEMELQPDIHAEFDDSALMLAFAQQGLGAFAAPELLSAHLHTQYGLVKVGTIERVTEHLYAISPERKLSHPAVVTLVKALRK
ncbi:transcriptional activator NhaR [Aestuariibacter sp. GS-14]|uniref:transcriptional activator NhaR n=1 Tax=Aestuariibacter sp. GS-14 TaxID=2590670 RepID=UPI0011291568|nr:transcriptional activator NhaR [Aestuariibacter sp. GS-14]TPV58427.1 transcriptional activator NhaR [Aestuariibacter sp. GS-14]